MSRNGKKVDTSAFPKVRNSLMCNFSCKLCRNEMYWED